MTGTRAYQHMGINTFVEVTNRETATPLVYVVNKNTEIDCDLAYSVNTADSLPLVSLTTANVSTQYEECYDSQKETALVSYFMNSLKAISFAPPGKPAMETRSMSYEPMLDEDFHLGESRSESQQHTSATLAPKSSCSVLFQISKYPNRKRARKSQSESKVSSLKRTYDESLHEPNSLLISQKESINAKNVSSEQIFHSAIQCGATSFASQSTQTFDIPTEKNVKSIAVMTVKYVEPEIGFDLAWQVIESSAILASDMDLEDNNNVLQPIKEEPENESGASKPRSTSHSSSERNVAPSRPYKLRGSKSGIIAHQTSKSTESNRRSNSEGSVRVTTLLSPEINITTATLDDVNNISETSKLSDFPSVQIEDFNVLKLKASCGDQRPTGDANYKPAADPIVQSKPSKKCSALPIPTTAADDNTLNISSMTEMLRSTTSLSSLSQISDLTMESFDDPTTSISLSLLLSSNTDSTFT